MSPAEQALRQFCDLRLTHEKDVEYDCIVYIARISIPLPPTRSVSIPAQPGSVLTLVSRELGPSDGSGEQDAKEALLQSAILTLQNLHRHAELVLQATGVAP